MANLSATYSKAPKKPATAQTGKQAFAAQKSHPQSTPPQFADYQHIR